MKKVLKYLGMWVLSTIAGAIIALIPAMILMAILGKDNPWPLVIISLFADLVPLYVFWKRRYVNLSFLWSEKAKRIYLWVIIAGLGYYLAETFLEQYITFPDEDGDWSKTLESMMRNPLGIIDVCIIAPILEEAICRGAILRAMLKKNWNYWVAIVASAAVFGLAHMNLTQGVPAFIWGIFIGWIYYRTRSIWPGVLIHMVNNTIATVAGLCLPETAMTPEQTTPLIYTLIAVPLGLAILAVALKKIDNKADDVDLSIPLLDDEDYKALRLAEATQSYMPPTDAPVVGTPVEPVNDTMVDDTPTE